MMKENHYSIVVTDMERRIIIKALTLLKDKQIHDNKKFDFIDDLIVRSCDAPLINKRIDFMKKIEQMSIFF